MNDQPREDEVGVTPADLTPEEAEVLRIKIESEIIREEWRERQAPEE